MSRKPTVLKRRTPKRPVTPIIVRKPVPTCSSDWACAICLEDNHNLKDTSKRAMIVKCGHHFCYDCIYQWVRKDRSTYITCPVCKQDFDRMRIFLWKEVIDTTDTTMNTKKEKCGGGGDDDGDDDDHILPPVHVIPYKEEKSVFFKNKTLSSQAQTDSTHSDSDNSSNVPYMPVSEYDIHSSMVNVLHMTVHINSRERPYVVN